MALGVISMPLNWQLDCVSFQTLRKDIEQGKSPLDSRWNACDSIRLLEDLIRAAVGCWWSHFPHSTSRGLVVSPAAPRAQVKPTGWIPPIISQCLPFLLLAAMGYPQASKEQTDLEEQNEARAGFVWWKVQTCTEGSRLSPALPRDEPISAPSLPWWLMFD